jgi:RimJ/RimL family protein N-acetyltransferase
LVTPSGGGQQEFRLRPLEQPDLAIFEDDYSSRKGAGEYQWFGFSSPGRGLVEMGALTSVGGRLTAIAAGRVVGSVFWFRKEYVPPETSWCWELALHIRAQERGKGYGTRCTQLISRYLFDHTRTHRLQAITDTENLAGQRVLEACGYTFEGILRAVQWREGAWHNLRMYSLLRGEEVP